MRARLCGLADLVVEGTVVADVGTDHAQLPIHLLKSAKISCALASDINIGPLAVARANIAGEGLARQVDLRLGSGLAPYRPNEADVFIIAGMGGHTIADILAADPAVARAARYLLLQPMQNRPFLRRWLYRHDYAIAREVVVREGDKFYHLMKVLPQSAVQPGECALLFGVNADRSDVYFDYLKSEIDRRAALLRRLKATNNAVRSDQISAELAQLKGVYRERNS